MLLNLISSQPNLCLQRMRLSTYATVFELLARRLFGLFLVTPIEKETRGNSAIVPVHEGCCLDNH